MDGQQTNIMDKFKLFESWRNLWNNFPNGTHNYLVLSLHAGVKKFHLYGKIEKDFIIKKPTSFRFKPYMLVHTTLHSISTHLVHFV